MWNEDYREMLCALRDAEVDYILIGAFALAAHGFPRATLDIDLWVRPTQDNARRVCQALAQFGAPRSQIVAGDFEKPDVVVQIGVAPRRIDFVTSISGVAYDDAAKNAIERDIDGLNIRILSAQDFVRNKLASGRPKDIADAELLRNRPQ